MVEIIIGSGQPSVWVWLAPVLALCGSVLLFSGAMITLWRTNKAADRRAIQARESERERDFRLWQRDTLHRLGSEAYSTGVAARNLIYRAYQLAANPGRDEFAPIEDRIETLAALAAQMKLAGAEAACASCVSMRDTIHDDDLFEAIVEHAKLRREGVVGKELEDAKARVQQGGEAIRLATSVFGQAVEYELARLNEPRTPSSPATQIAEQLSGSRPPARQED